MYTLSKIDSKNYQKLVSTLIIQKLIELDVWATMGGKIEIGRLENKILATKLNFEVLFSAECNFNLYLLAYQVISLSHCWLS